MGTALTTVNDAGMMPRRAWESIADALGVALTIEPAKTTKVKGKAKGVGLERCIFDAKNGCETRNIGPFTANMPLKLRADEVSKTTVSAIVRLIGDVYAYVIATAKSDLTLLIFDAKLAGVDHEYLSKTATGDTRATLLKIQPAVRAVFDYDYVNYRWLNTGTAALDAVVDRF